VADAVSRVVRARRVIEQHRKESEGK